MKYSEQLSEKLNDLLTRTYDAEKGFKLAQDKVENPSIKKFLADKVQQRYHFGHELKTEITSFGQLPGKGGSLKGDIHRTWMNLSEALTTNGTERILEEVERGEKASLETYDTILEDENITLPPSTESLLIKQRNAIQAAIETNNMYEEKVS